MDEISEVPIDVPGLANGVGQFPGDFVGWRPPLHFDLGNSKWPSALELLLEMRALVEHEQELTRPRRAPDLISAAYSPGSFSCTRAAFVNHEPTYR